MAQYLSQEQIAQYRECFSLYDKKRNGKILSSVLCDVMRSLGSSPTQMEVKAHLKSLGEGTKNELDFSEFLTIMHNQLAHENPYKEILEAFKLSDKNGRGTIPASHLRHILMKTGEKLSARDVEQIFRAGNVRGNEPVPYEDFLRKVMTPLPDY